jgi:hypothetical protein
MPNTLLLKKHHFPLTRGKPARRPGNLRYYQPGGYVLPSRGFLSGLGQDDDDDTSFDFTDPTGDLGLTATPPLDISSLFPVSTLAIPPVSYTAGLVDAQGNPLPVAPGTISSPGSINLGSPDSGGNQGVYGITSNGSSVLIGNVNANGSWSQSPQEAQAAQQVASAGGGSASTLASQITQLTSQVAGAVKAIASPTATPSVNPASIPSAPPGYTSIGGYTISNTTLIWAVGGVTGLIFLSAMLGKKRR